MLEFKPNTEFRVGVKQSSRAILEGKAAKLYVAKDADQHVVGSVMTLAKEHNVDIEIVSSMKELGRACKIDVGAATAVILNK